MRVQEVTNLGTKVLPLVVYLVAENSTELLQPAIGLGSIGHDPWSLPRAVHQPWGGRGYTRIVEHGLELGDGIRGGGRRSAGRVIIVEAKLRKVSVGVGNHVALGTLPSKGDAPSDEF